MQYIFPGNNVSSCVMFEVVLCLRAPLMTSYIYFEGERGNRARRPEDVSENESEEPEEESEVIFFSLH